VFPYPRERPATAKEAGIRTEKQYLPVAVVEDGYVSGENLKEAGRDRAWLEDILQKQKATLQETLLLTVDGGGQVVFLRKEKP